MNVCHYLLSMKNGSFTADKNVTQHSLLVRKFRNQTLSSLLWNSKNFWTFLYFHVDHLTWLKPLTIWDCPSDFKLIQQADIIVFSMHKRLYRTDPINVGGTIGTEIMPNRLICAMKFLSLEIQVHITSASSSIQNCLYSTV